MRTLIIITLNLFMSLTAFAQENTNLTINFEGFVEAEGELFIGVYEKDNFLGQPFQTKTLVVKADENQVTFENLPKGEYAVSVYHDLNGNEQFDMDEYGRPVEPWVMSGNVNPNQRPLWDDAKINLDDTDEKITLKF